MSFQKELSQEEIFPLTGLRFIAALYVFVFHIHLRWPLFPESNFISNIFSQGAVGMSLFFVLSGFILAHRYGDQKVDFRSYLINRFSRIYPVYIFVAILTLPWIGINFVADSAYGITHQVGAAVTLILADVFLIQAWFPPLFNYWNNSGSSSISVEVFCYLLLPFILPKLVSIGNKKLVIITAVAYILAILPGVILVLFYDKDGMQFYSVPIYRLPEFVVGICTSLAVRRFRFSRVKSEILQVILMLTLIIYLGIAGPKFPMWISHNWIVLPTIALTIYTTSQSIGLFSKILSFKPLVWAGHISYSFYSLQLLVLLVLKSYHKEIVNFSPVMHNNVVLLLTSFLALMILAALSYHYVEEPMRHRIKARRKIDQVGVLGAI